MKKVICNDELKKIVLDSVNMLCDAVSSTLGPSGNNVLISTSDFSPFITNVIWFTQVITVFRKSVTFGIVAVYVWKLNV